jgi:hypothetical protein
MFRESEKDRIRAAFGRGQAIRDPIEGGLIRANRLSGAEAQRERGIGVDFARDHFQRPAFDLQIRRLAAGQITAIDRDRVLDAWFERRGDHRVDVGRAADVQPIEEIAAAAVDEVPDLDGVIAVVGGGEIDERIAAEIVAGVGQLLALGIV